MYFVKTSSYLFFPFLCLLFHRKTHRESVHASIKICFLGFFLLYFLFPYFAFVGTDCPILGTPVNGRKYGSKYNHGNIVTFDCNHGFVLKGSAVRRCMENGTWNGTEAICRGKKWWYKMSNQYQFKVFQYSFSETWHQLSKRCIVLSIG